MLPTRYSFTLINLIVRLLVVHAQWEIIQNTVSEPLQTLTHKIIKENMKGYNCLVWLSEKSAKWPVNLVSHDFLVPVLSIDSTYLNAVLVDIFKLQCRGYVIQTSNPGYFLELWELERLTSIDRHNPKMLFLPWNETAPNSDQLFRLPETQYLSDLLLVEINATTDRSNGDSFNIVTNNFFAPFHNENRKAGLTLAVWPLDHNIEFFPDKILNLQGKTLRIGTLQYPPYSIVEPFEGMESKVIQVFCEKHNCTIETVTDDNLWGEILENKSGNGIVGNVFTDKADLGIGAIYSWYIEYIYLDFTYPYLESKVTVLVPKPQHLPEWMIPVNTFKPSMWLALLISLVLIIISLYSVNKYADKIVLTNSKLVVESFSSWTSVTLQAVGMSLLQPPATRIPSGSPLQRFFTLSEVFFLLFTTIYSAALASILTVPAYYPPIDNGRDLFMSGITWISSHDAWTYSIRDASEPYLRGLVNSFKAYDTKTLKKLAKLGGYGFAIEIMAGGHVTHQAHLSDELISELHVMKHELYRTPSVMILRKGSAYTEHLRHLTHRCIDSGLLLYWEGYAAVKFLSSRLQTALELSKSSSHELTEPIKLKLVHVQGAFILLALGTIIALFIFLIEKYSQMLNKKHRLRRLRF